MAYAAARRLHSIIRELCWMLRLNVAMHGINQWLNNNGKRMTRVENSPEYAQFTPLYTFSLSLSQSSVIHYSHCTRFAFFSLSFSSITTSVRFNFQSALFIIYMYTRRDNALLHQFSSHLFLWLMMSQN